MDLRVLVVCPDQDSAKLLSTVLAEMEIKAEHTPSISRGLERLHDEIFDAVILDYRADQSSEEFLGKLRQTHTRTRKTLLIAILDADFSARPVFGLGANFVLYRPLSLERTRLSLRAARGLMRRERRRGPRIHDPYSTLFGTVRQTGGLWSSARHRDRDVYSSVRLIGAVHVIPHRSVFGFDPGSVRLGRIQRLLSGVFVGHRFELPVLSDPIQVSDAGALHREWLAAGLSGPIVAKQPIGALLQSLVCVIGLPLNHCRPVPHLARRGGQGPLNAFRRRLRDGTCRYDQHVESGRNHVLHCVTSRLTALNPFAQRRQKKHVQDMSKRSARTKFSIARLQSETDMAQ